MGALYCMKIAFCGHSDYVPCANDECLAMEFLFQNIPCDEECEFFLGEYGSFDSFAYGIAKKYKKNKPTAKLIFVTPYISNEYLKRHDVDNRFDLVIYPELEKSPPRFAIAKRNKWIAKNTDILICFVNRKLGGAYTMLNYAKKYSKIIFNLAEQNDIDV